MLGNKICGDVIKGVLSDLIFPPVEMSYGVFSVFRFRGEVKFYIEIDEICKGIFLF